MKDRKEREERIEKRLGLRDDNLMKMVREIQDAKRTIVLAQEEIAAPSLRRSLGGCFGNEYHF